MFKLDLAPTFGATVRIPQPGGAKVAVRVTFNYLDADQYRATFDKYRTKPAAEWLTQLIAGWETEDLPGEWEGMPMPFSQDALAQLAIKQPRAIAAFVDTYQHEVLGLPLKN
ncbi:phage tail assembly chaperone [Thauera propionica]|jgi:hypothetical protein|uniref:phage tail assembly chaperone n=1 Tax=Thauera propionica TaxID=2019431 RepID=UPI0023F576B8|nr:phage tail assembly chaperone [Thauera propionica]MDD3675807.1 phage tail assembly chaperone [Thauera propionica]